MCGLIVSKPQSVVAGTLWHVKLSRIVTLFLARVKDRKKFLAAWEKSKSDALRNVVSQAVIKVDFSI